MYTTFSSAELKKVPRAIMNYKERNAQKVNNKITFLCAYYTINHFSRKKTVLNKSIQDSNIHRYNTKKTCSDTIRYRFSSCIFIKDYL